MNDWRADISRHYVDTICLYKGKPYEIGGVAFPSEIENDREKLNKIFAGTYKDTLKIIHMMIRPYGLHAVNYDPVPFTELSFPFPECSLVNSEDRGFPKVDFINRYPMKQYRRGLRQDALHIVTVNRNLARKLRQSVYSKKSPPKRLTSEFLIPQFYSLDAAVNMLKEKPGTVAISRDFWVGTGTKRSLLNFGYQYHIVGSCDDRNRVIKLDPRASELHEQLEEAGYHVHVA